MGCLFSCCITSSPEPLDCVRVIYINGYIEDYLCPVTVSQITRNAPKHVLCTAVQLFSVGAQQLKADDQLVSGRIYFLMPPSVFRSDLSPVDLASLATRLTATAKKAGPLQPVEVMSDCEKGKLDDGLGEGLPQGKVVWSQPRTWKPVLETIRELSFCRRESMMSMGSKSIGSMRDTSISIMAE